MKYIIILMLLPCAALSQRIVKNEIDPFNKERRIETNYVYLKMGMVQFVSTKYRSVGDACYMLFKGGYWGAGVIGEGDSFIFLLDNDSTVTIQPTDIQATDLDNHYTHQYHISKDQIQLLASRKVKSIRKYYSSSYADMELPEKNQNKLRELSSLFLQSL